MRNIKPIEELGHQRGTLYFAQSLSLAQTNNFLSPRVLKTLIFFPQNKLTRNSTRPSRKNVSHESLAESLSLSLSLNLCVKFLGFVRVFLLCFCFVRVLVWSVYFVKEENYATSAKSSSRSGLGTKKKTNKRPLIWFWVWAFTFWTSILGFLFFLFFFFSFSFSIYIFFLITTMFLLLFLLRFEIMIFIFIIII